MRLGTEAGLLPKGHLDRSAEIPCVTAGGERTQPECCQPGTAQSTGGEQHWGGQGALSGRRLKAFEGSISMTFH